MINHATLKNICQKCPLLCFTKKAEATTVLQFWKEAVKNDGTNLGSVESANVKRYLQFKLAKNSPRLKYFRRKNGSKNIKERHKKFKPPDYKHINSLGAARASKFAFKRAVSLD